MLSFHEIGDKGRGGGTEGKGGGTMFYNILYCMKLLNT